MIDVTFADRSSDQFPEAVGFEIDDGALILIDPNDCVVAAFAPGAWARVCR